MRGFLNINKPTRLTSRAIVDAVSRLLKTRKVGHAGTLDPLATGVLVVAVGAATRLVSYVQSQPKEYLAEFLLGCRSDTDDVTGTVTEVPVADPPGQVDVEQLLPRFTGRISQVPPAYSAVHVGGERAYDLARRDEAFELAAREVDVYALAIEAFAWPRLSLRIECGSGTYVRSIGRDLGEALGSGAVMCALVRTRVGEFRVEDAAPLDALTLETARRAVQPLIRAVPHLPQRECTDFEIAEVRQGRAIRAADDSPEVALAGGDGELIALARYDSATRRLRPHLVLAPP